MSTRVLVTNDDGIDGPGLRALVPALVEHGYAPIVVAPNADYSGAGTSLISETSTAFSDEFRLLPYEQRVLPEAPNVEAYAVAAPPAMCALLAMRGAFGEAAELVASGINFGLNVGPATRHSGTVSAALTAAAFDVPALAISSQFNFEDPDAPLRYDTAAAVAMQVLDVLATTDHSVINLNVPQLAYEDLAGIRAAPIATASGFQSYVEERTDTALKLGYRISDEPVPADTDSALVKAGFAVVSSLRGVSSTECGDLVAKLIEAAA